ncbi:hypothetical protein [Helicobacter sp. T3_23-1056]
MDLVADKIIAHKNPHKPHKNSTTKSKLCKSTLCVDSWQSINKKNIVILRFRKKPKYLKTSKCKQRYFANAQYDNEISVIARIYEVNSWHKPAATK